MKSIFNTNKTNFSIFDWLENDFLGFNNFMQCDLGDNINPLVHNMTIFKTTENNTYFAELTYPSFVTADMIDIDVIDEKRTLTISTHFKDDNGIETSSATMERLPDDADISSLVASFDNGKLMLTMNKLTKETTPKTIDVRHI